VVNQDEYILEVIGSQLTTKDIWVLNDFGIDLPLLFKVHKIWSVDSQKIIKIVATRCHILRLKCTKFDFGWDRTCWRCLQRSPRSPIWI